MKKYIVNIDNANSEVRKWLDEVANKRIHQTTLQMPFSLLAEERYHLLPLPKPYLGIHPKAMNVIVSKNRDNQNINQIFIANRDMQSYDVFIPSITTIAILPSVINYGGALWNY
jgi:hypothetical protein